MWHGSECPHPVRSIPRYDDLDGEDDGIGNGSGNGKLDLEINVLLFGTKNFGIKSKNIPLES